MIESSSSTENHGTPLWAVESGVTTKEGLIMHKAWFLTMEKQGWATVKLLPVTWIFSSKCGWYT